MYRGEIATARHCKLDLTLYSANKNTTNSHSFPPETTFNIHLLFTPYVGTDIPDILHIY